MDQRRCSVLEARLPVCFNTFMSQPISLYIDADACPVKDEVYRVAERHLQKGVALKVFVVANSFINTPRVDYVERVIVPGGMDVADDWIAERRQTRRCGDHRRRAACGARAVEGRRRRDRAERQSRSRKTTSARRWRRAI